MPFSSHSLLSSFEPDDMDARIAELLGISVEEWQARLASGPALPSAKERRASLATWLAATEDGPV